jgi:large subunit ribosomal protein L18
MAMGNIERRDGRLRRKARVRKRVFGTSERPRLNVFRSAKHIYAQVVNDDEGNTLVAASTVEGHADLSSGKKIDRAAAVGKLLAERCKARGIDAVVFDRNGYKYHGRVRAVADAAREGGLNL